MIKLYIFALSFCFVISGNDATGQTVQLNSDKTTISIYDQSDLEFKIANSIAELETQIVTTQNGEFVKISIPTYTNSGRNGEPQLPALIKKIEIPQDAEPLVEVISYDLETIDLANFGITKKILPRQPSMSKSQKASELTFHYNQGHYQTNQFTGNGIATLNILGQSRNIRLGTLTICPFEYNPVTNQLMVYNNIKLKVTFNNADLIKTEFLKQHYDSPYFNARQLQTLNQTGSQTMRDLITTYPVTYVIVSSPSFSAELQPLIQWKTKKGFKVIEAYTNNPLVGTTTTSIKN